MLRHGVGSTIERLVVDGRLDVLAMRAVAEIRDTLEPGPSACLRTTGYAERVDVSLPATFGLPGYVNVMENLQRYCDWCAWIIERSWMVAPIVAVVVSGLPVRHVERGFRMRSGTLRPRLVPAIEQYIVLAGWREIVEMDL